MTKKLGISVGFLSAIAVFLGWYNLTAVLIVTMVVLFAEEDQLIKKNVLNAFFYSLIFTIAHMVLGWISSGFIGFLGFLADARWISFFTYDTFNIVKYFDLANYIDIILKIAKFVFMIIFVIVAFKGKEISIPLADILAKKAMGIVEAKKEKNPADADTKENDPGKDASLTSDKATLTDIPKD